MLTLYEDKALQGHQNPSPNHLLTSQKSVMLQGKQSPGSNHINHILQENKKI